MRFVPMMRDYDDDLDLFDDVFSTPFFKGNEGLMKTDVTEKDGRYYLTMDLPGFKKEDVKVSLYNGNLTIEASRSNSNDEKDTKGNVIRQERYSGSCSRAFYVGKSVHDSDIHASFDNGVLKIDIPTEQQKEVEEKKLIAIE